MRDFSGRVAFVTGGASGIGLAIVRALLTLDMAVVVADRNSEHIETAKQQGDLRDRKVMFLALDVADRAGMADARDRVCASFGSVSLLCNNAGIVASSAIEDADFNEWDRVLATNLSGVINGIVTFLPDMRARRFGHIVNTASMASFLASPGRSGLYVTSKYAVRGLTESLRLSVARDGVGVSLLCPGAVVTRITQAADPQTCGGDAIAVDAGAVSADEVARQMIGGIRSNSAYIFTHGGFRGEIEDDCAALIAAVPPGAAAADAFHVDRRRRIAEARRDSTDLAD